MIPQNFGAQYSDVYDSLYHDKSYVNECDLIERFFHTYQKEKSIKNILDLGCGTGGHVFELINRGYSCIGVDLSSRMIQIAKEKSKHSSVKGDKLFFEGDIRHYRTDAKFDAAIMMFAVLGYQTSNADVQAALNTVRHHLNPGGIFILDVWFGPAVLIQRPSEKVKVVRKGDIQIIRTAHSELDIVNQTCDVNYHIWQMNGDKLIADTTETHRMRYYFARELDVFLQMAGMRLLTIEDINHPGRIPDHNSWNVVGVAEAI